MLRQIDLDDTLWVDVFNNKIKINKINDSDENIIYKTNTGLIINKNTFTIEISNKIPKIFGFYRNNQIIWDNNTKWILYKNQDPNLNLDLFYTNKAGPLYVLKNDYYFHNSLKKGKVWEELTINKMEKFIKCSTNVIDIGAHIGSHTLTYNKMIKGNVYSFEAQNKIFNILKLNVENQNPENVFIFNFAVGHKNGVETSINDSSIDGTKLKNGLIYNTNEYINYGGVQLGNGKEKVIMRTIDSFNFDNIGYIKIDVEGCEELVLFGAFDTIKRCRPVIIFEYRSDKTITEDMKKTLDVDDNIINLNTIKKIEKELNYVVWTDYKYLGHDSLLIPYELKNDIPKLKNE